MLIFTQTFAAACELKTFLGIPPWYKYLVNAGRMEQKNSGLCEFVSTFDWAGAGGGDIALILLGILDIMLRVAALVAIGYVVYGSIQYVTSDGQPDKTKSAQSTIINALVGLVIAFIATAALSFIARAISAPVS